jgi:hypothetical protein
MFPFVASQAIALRQATQKPVKAGPRRTGAAPPVRPAKKGRFRRILDALIESRRRKADLELDAHRRRHDVDTHD